MVSPRYYGPTATQESLSPRAEEGPGVSVAEAAELLGVKPSRIRRLLREGILRGEKGDNNRWARVFLAPGAATCAREDMPPPPDADPTPQLHAHPESRSRDQEFWKALLAEKDARIEELKHQNTFLQQNLSNTQVMLMQVQQSLRALMAPAVDAKIARDGEEDNSLSDVEEADAWDDPAEATGAEPAASDFAAEEEMEAQPEDTVAEPAPQPAAMPEEVLLATPPSPPPPHTRTNAQHPLWMVLFMLILSALVGMLGYLIHYFQMTNRMWP